MAPLSIKGISQCLQDLRDVWLNYPLHPLQVSVALPVINFTALFSFQGCCSVAFHCNDISGAVLKSSQQSLYIYLCVWCWVGVFVNESFSLSLKINHSPFLGPRLIYNCAYMINLVRVNILAASCSSSQSWGGKGYKINLCVSFLSTWN